jgi:hypothetical protein
VHVDLGFGFSVVSNNLHPGRARKNERMKTVFVGNAKCTHRSVGTSSFGSCDIDVDQSRSDCGGGFSVVLETVDSV